MSITSKVVNAGVQGATATAKDQVKSHFKKEIDASPVSPRQKNMRYIAMEGATAAGSVALAEVILKVLEGVYKSKGKPKADGKSEEKSSGNGAATQDAKKSQFETQMHNVLTPALAGFAVGAALPIAVAAMDKG